jgi:NADPH-dependent curcumin reductase CurA
MRLRMSEIKNYAPPAAIGEVMVGSTLGRVIATRNDKFQAGDLVAGMGGWQTHWISDAKGLRRVDSDITPLGVHLAALGAPGVTAWIGLLDIGQPQAGETVLVSAAAGAVGGVVGQIAKLKGCRVVGIAGGAAKCAYVRDELGFDACVDYTAADFSDALRAALPRGVDVYFENVGGTIFDVVLPLLNAFARIPFCGIVSQYNAIEPYGVKNLRSLLVNRVRLQGFILSDHNARWKEALPQLTEWYRGGQIRHRETVAEGLAQAPSAFIGMLRGANIGKQLVQLV